MRTLDYPHIITTNGEPARLERFPRTRVAQIVADHLGFGWSAEEISRQYEYLTLAEIHAALGYYYNHRQEIDDQLDAELNELELASERPASSLRLRLIAARRNKAA
jgi:Protein of unknown function (DUF433)